MKEEAETFEGCLARLEQIVTSLEKGDTSLEEGLSLFEEGVRLTRRCHELLADCEERVSKLVRVEEDGSFRLAPASGESFQGAPLEESPGDANP